MKIRGQNASMVSKDSVVDTIQYDTVHQNYLYAICVSKTLDMVTVVLSAREPRSPTDRLPEYYQYAAYEYGEYNTKIGIDRGWSKIIGEKGQLLDEILVQAQRHNCSRLLLVGHGGGGVLATLCGVWACRRRRRTRQNQLIQIISFGLRPVGDANFKKLHGLLEHQGQLQHLRFSNQSDCRSMATEFFTSNSNRQEEVEEEQRQKDLLPRRGAFGALVSLQDVNVQEKAHSIEAYDETVRDWVQSCHMENNYQTLSDLILLPFKTREASAAKQESSPPACHSLSFCQKFQILVLLFLFLIYAPLAFLIIRHHTIKPIQSLKQDAISRQDRRKFLSTVVRLNQESPFSAQTMPPRSLKHRQKFLSRWFKKKHNKLHATIHPHTQHRTANTEIEYIGELINI